MSISIKTVKLQSLLSKSMKGASQNKNYPLTNLLCIDCRDGKITLGTTDMDNYLFVSDEIDSKEPFYVVVGIDLFSKLVTKFTCEEVKFAIEDNVLLVRGNGFYKIDLPLNEEGELIKFPDPIDKFFATHEGEITTSEIKYGTIDRILNTAKSSLLQAANSFDKNVVCYCGYYTWDKVISTDTNVMCCIDEPVFEEPALINSNLMDLFALFDKEVISVSRYEDTAVFDTENVKIYGVFMESAIREEYRIDDILPLFSLEYGSVCSVQKDEFCRILERLSLFVGPYDDDQIKLTFTEDNIVIESKQNNSKELLPVMSLRDFKPFVCYINVVSLMSQVKAYEGKMIEIHFGIDVAIKFVYDNTTQIIALEEA